MCRNPFITVGAAHGCGQCLWCRVNRSRIWKTRMLLEQNKWKESAFLSLTYSDENLRFTDVSGSEATLVPRDLQTFLKRLRWSVRPARLRYYAVGEYGRDGLRESIWNPHYHAIVFGFQTCLNGDSSLAAPRLCMCVPCVLVRRAWGLGRVHLGTVAAKSVSYVSGYIVEKLRTEVRHDLGKRSPEFSRMSLRPALGIEAISDVARVISRYELAEGVDVPNSVRVGRALMPIGRTLVRRLRKELGRDEKAPESFEKDEMFILRLRSFRSKKRFRDVLYEAGSAKAHSLEVKVNRERKKR